jgi:hypothetical protein
VRRCDVEERLFAFSSNFSWSRKLRCFFERAVLGDDCSVPTAPLWSSGRFAVLRAGLILAPLVLARVGLLTLIFGGLPIFSVPEERKLVPFVPFF